jgi:F420H(2)-dependent quinone reductase
VTRTDKTASKPIPSWLAQAIWAIHRAIYRITRGRIGLWRPKYNRWGAMRLRTIGRRTGAERVAILGYFEDGPNLVAMAMNGWLEPEPKWWLNLQARPEATAELPGGIRIVRARAAQGDERSRLWAKWREIYAIGDLDAHATLRSGETAVVVLEPVSPSPAASHPAD